jgi:hypothetical protein
VRPLKQDTHIKVRCSKGEKAKAIAEARARQITLSEYVRGLMSPETAPRELVNVYAATPGDALRVDLLSEEQRKALDLPCIYDCACGRTYGTKRWWDWLGKWQDSTLEQRRQWDYGIEQCQARTPD